LHIEVENGVMQGRQPWFRPIGGILGFFIVVLPSFLHLSGEAERLPPIIGRTCAFDAKIYKNVDGFLAVSACGKGNKKIFQLFYFCSALPSHLVENPPNSKLKTQNRNRPSFAVMIGR